MFTRSLASLAVASLALTAACSDSGSTSPAGMKAASLSFAMKPAAGTTVMPDVIVGAGNDTLVLQTAQVVLDHIEVAQANSATCDGTEGDGCNEMELGPVLVDLPLNGAVTTDVNVALPAGTYSKLEFKLRAPTGDDSNVVKFLQQNPDFAGVSVKVTGTFNGTPFTYTSKVDAGTELEFNPPVTIDSSSNNVTVSVDISKWFRDGTGALVDPATANQGGANEGLVNSNIETSFQAYEDDNRDGSDDSGSDSSSSAGSLLNR